LFFQATSALGKSRTLTAKGNIPKEKIREPLLPPVRIKDRRRLSPRADFREHIAEKASLEKVGDFV